MSLEDIPSKRIQLLQHLKGKKITKLIRYSWWNGDQATDFLEVQSSEVFSLTAGPLLIYLESGWVIGAASHPSLNSVTLWLEEDEHKTYRDLPCKLDPELYPIDALDQVYSDSYWHGIVGQTVKEIHLIKREPQNVLYLDLPREVGVHITMENGLSFILSHGLHDNSDTFSVITTSQIDPDVLPQLQFL